MTTLTRDQALQLVEAQQKLDGAEWEALAFTITCVPSDVRSEDLNDWRDTEHRRITGPALAARDALLQEFGVNPQAWNTRWKEAKATALA